MGPMGPMDIEILEAAWSEPKASWELLWGKFLDFLEVVLKKKPFPKMVV